MVRPSWVLCLSCACDFPSPTTNLTIRDTSSPLQTTTSDTATKAPPCEDSAQAPDGRCVTYQLLDQVVIHGAVKASLADKFPYPQAYCAEGDLAVGMRAHFDDTYIRGLQMLCTQLDPAGQLDGGTYTTAYQGSDVSAPSQEDRVCPTGHALIGVDVSVDSFGLGRLEPFCERIADIAALESGTRNSLDPLGSNPSGDSRSLRCNDEFVAVGWWGGGDGSDIHGDNSPVAQFRLACRQLEYVEAT